MGYREAIEDLLKAKSKIEETTSKLRFLMGIFMESEIFSDKQMISSKIKDGFSREEDGFQNIWNIKIEKKEYSVNLTQDPVFRKYAKRYLPKSLFKIKSEHIEKTVYNNYSIPSS